MITLTGKYTTANIHIDQVEPELLTQLTLMVNHPALTNPVEIMPDTHAGKGSVIGFTMKLTDKVVPNVVGVDIGCGMLAACLGTWPGHLSPEDMDNRIRRGVPMGNNQRRDAFFTWDNVVDMTVALQGPKGEAYDGAYLADLLKRIGSTDDKMLSALGTLGGGNHFIELAKDSENKLWLVIHSGSRNLGLKICEWHQKRALTFNKDRYNAFVKDKIEELKKTCPKKKLERAIQEVQKGYQSVPAGMEYLEDKQADSYLRDMVFAQAYASWNREAILGQIIHDLNWNHEWIELSDKFETIHNYIDFTRGIIRKGAVRAEKNERLIIPLNMKDGSLVCKGKGNPDWNYSAPHGAGRVLSRTKAKATLTLTDFLQKMDGVYSSSVCKSTLDEAPMAYKDPELIEKAIEPTVEVVDKFRPVLNIKAL